MNDLPHLSRRGLLLKSNTVALEQAFKEIEELREILHKPLPKMTSIDHKMIHVLLIANTIQCQMEKNPGRE